MKKVLKGAAAVFALIPGVAVLQTGLGVPPDAGMKLIFGGMIEAFGVLTLILLSVNRNWIKALSPRKVTVTAIALAVASFVALVVYIGCYQFCVVTVDPRGTVYFPLWAEGGLAEMISSAGGRAAAIEAFGRYAVYEATKGGNALPGILTTVVFLLLYTTVFTSLTWAFGLPATHEAPGEDVLVVDQAPKSS